MDRLFSLKNELKSKASPKKARLLMRFFKTGPGEYGEGDIFCGVMVPQTRATAQKYADLGLASVVKLLRSKIHEERLSALLILVKKFEAGEKMSEIYNLYLKNAAHINNWDLVDLSVHKIVGAYLVDKPKTVLYKLARSKNLWERRMAIIATARFIGQNEFSETLKIAEMLLKDEQDLIHKAVGWMLREIGKRDLKAEENFLEKYYKKMPRTMLRYAIEKFPPIKRKHYLK
jgi:3-methyladenine DNA glycosylase AlkD